MACGGVHGGGNISDTCSVGGIVLMQPPMDNSNSMHFM